MFGVDLVMCSWDPGLQNNLGQKCNSKQKSSRVNQHLGIQWGKIITTHIKIDFFPKKTVFSYK